MQDGRIKEIWPFAWEVFKAWPVFGSGILTYTRAVLSLGLESTMGNITYPHNIYLQLLAETGMVGLVLFLAFVGPLLYRSGRIIRNYMARESVEPGNKTLRLAILAASFWAASFAWLVQAISSHDFFRTWWLSLGCLLWGLTAGTTIRLRREGKVTH